ncbi:MAG: hypothetical protein WCJ30_18675 [Deltaproteobacteria bacterium]
MSVKRRALPGAVALVFAAFVSAACRQNGAAPTAPGAGSAVAPNAHIALSPPEVGLALLARNHDASGSQRAALSTVEPWAAASADLERASAQPGAPAHWRVAQLFVEGHANRLRGNVARSITLLREAVAAEPGWARAHVGLADALRHGADIPGCFAELARAEQLEPNWWVPVAQVAAMQASVGHSAESIATYRRALVIAPNESAILDGLALILSASGSDAEATRTAHAAIDHDADAPWAHVVLAEQALVHGDGATALTEATHATRVLPHSAAPEHARADALALLHRDDEARTAYQHAIQIGDESHQIGFSADRVAAVRDALAHNRLPPPRFENGHARSATASRDGGGSWGGLTGPDVDFERIGP